MINSNFNTASFNGSIVDSRSNFECLQLGQVQCWQGTHLSSLQLSSVVAIAPPYPATQSTQSPIAMDPWLVLQLMVVAVMPVIGYQRYRTLLKQHRVHRLERLWQLDGDRELGR
jgi:hypothetical protein